MTEPQHDPGDENDAADTPVIVETARCPFCGDVLPDPEYLVCGQCQMKRGCE